MQTTPLLPSLPLEAPDPSGVGPADMVVALIGRQNLLLPGFADETARKAHWRHPAAPFIPLGRFDEEKPFLAPRRVAWRQAVLAAIAVLLVCTSFAAGLFWASYTADWRSVKAPAPIWSIVEITPVGVMITLNSGKPVLVPVGGRLPNGEAVVSVSPETGSAFLEATTVIIRPSVKPLTLENESGQ